MKSPKFEIKLAILGHVSVGKTTLLNALLGNEFSQVSKKRTTAGINHFSVNFTDSSKEDGEPNEVPAKEDAVLVPTPNNTNELKMSTSTASTTITVNSSSSSTSGESELSEETTLLTAEQVLNQIIKTNKILREDGTLEEHTFDVEIRDKVPLIEMRSNTKLVITDIPGVNEARTSSMYLNYVMNAWDSFDCVLVVMDADQGVNTEEQVKLLEFVKTSIDTKKDIPVVILCNKVDDPEDDEIMILVNEIREEVERIFDVKGEDIIDFTSEDYHESDLDIVMKGGLKNVPIFLPISAENAFLYRVVAGLKRSDLHTLRKEYIDKIVREEVGKYKWRRLSDEEKYDLIFEVAANETEYDERLSISNFDKLMQVLGHILGGNERQADLIEKQLTIQLRKLSSNDSASFVDALSSIHDRASALGQSTSYLEEKFWDIYNELEKRVFDEFEKSPTKLEKLFHLIHALEKYSSTLRLKVSTAQLKDNVLNLKQDEKVLVTMKNIVKRFCEIICAKFETGNFIVDRKEDPWQFKNSYYDSEWEDYRTGWLNRDTLEFVDGDDSSERPEDTEVDKYHSHFKWSESRKIWKSKCTGIKYERSKECHPLDEINADSWDKLYIRDWSTIINSILIMRYQQVFVENFAKQINDLEWQLLKHFSQMTKCNPSFTTIDVPSSPASERHWGHLPWMFCHWVRKNEDKLNSNKAEP